MIFASTHQQRVVITGIGVVSPIGNNADDFWHSLTNDLSGIKKLDETFSQMSPCQYAGYVANFQGHINDFEHLDSDTRKKVRKALKLMSRETKMALAACTQALADSTYKHENQDPERVGVSLGTGDMTMVPDDFLEAVKACQDENREFQFSDWGLEGIPNIEPLWLLKCLPNMSACHIAIYHDFQGPNNSITQRETASNIALAEAYRIISDGDADIMIAGGTGTTMLPMNFVHNHLEDEESSVENDSCRPFDRNRSGAVAGEGAAIVVLEELSSALDRGARIYGEIRGTGASTAFSGSHHANREQAVANAIRMALKDANASIDHVGHINAHGLSTRVTDQEESLGIRKIFGSQADRIPVTGIKSYTGNAGAGSGAMEFVASLLAMKNERLFPIFNCHEPDPECPITPVRNHETNPGKSFLNVNIVPHGQASSIYVEQFQE